MPYNKNSVKSIVKRSSIQQKAKVVKSPSKSHTERTNSLRESRDSGNTTPTMLPQYNNNQALDRTDMRIIENKEGQEDDPLIKFLMIRKNK